MNRDEQARAAQVSAELDLRLEEKGRAQDESLSPEVREALATAEHLAALDLAAGTGSFKSTLRSQLMVSVLESRESQRKQSMLSGILNRRIVQAGLIALLLLALLLGTPLRSLAGALLRQIGGITLSSTPSLAEQLAAGEQPATAPLENIPTAMPPALLSVEDAQALAGFEVAEISAPAGFALTGREVYPGAEGIMDVLTRYRREEEFLSLSQTFYPQGLAAPFGQWNIGSAPVRDSLVRGLDGVYVEQAPIIAVPGETPGSISAAGANLLIWEEDGFTFTLMSSSLGEADLIAVAETLNR